MTLALFRRRTRPAPPDPAALALQDDLARITGWPVRRCAVPAVPREPEPRPGALGYAVAILREGDGHYLGLTHVSALAPGEAVREAIACNRSRDTTGRYMAVEVRRLGSRA